MIYNGLSVEDYPPKHKFNQCPGGKLHHMDKYVYTIINSGPPYPKNLARLARFYELHHTGGTKKEIMSIMDMGEQMYWRYQRQLKNIIDEEPIAISPFPFPKNIIDGVISPLILLNRLLHLMSQNEVVLGVPRHEIISKYKAKVDSNPKNQQAIMIPLVEAIAKFALYANDFDYWKSYIGDTELPPNYLKELLE